MTALQPLDVEMMRRALEIAAQAAEAGEIPVGAVIYRGEEILRGFDEDVRNHLHGELKKTAVLSAQQRFF